jgi:hypothetical protein
MAYSILREHIEREIVVGGYGRGRGWRAPSYLGPSGPSWEREDSRGYFQTERNVRLVDIEYYSTGGTRIPVYQIRSSDLALIDNTLDLVPPEHLAWLKLHKREGIVLANEAGRGRHARYTGGLNAGYDDRATSFINERNGLIITYGAVWQNRHLGIVPTIFHEIGHVLTKRSRISYNYFPNNRAGSLRNTRVSRNAGSLEALCNIYMFMICYGSYDSAVCSYGTGSSQEKDAIAREGIRSCPAFTSMLSENWRERFNER